MKKFRNPELGILNKDLRHWVSPFWLLDSGFWILLSLLIISLPCCAANKNAMDLADYVNDGILRISQLEEKSLEAYASVTGQNYTTDDKMYEALKDRVIPLYKRFADGLRSIHSENDEVIVIHRIYIEGAQSLYRGFRMMMLGLEKRDRDMVLQANQEIEKGRSENERWRRELMALYKKYGLEIVEKPKI